MKLISAYVSGFGKLTDYTLEYSPTLTAFCMENGWGKSTLAYFHKAMFYGLDSTQKLKGEPKERERFKPWTSAPFGGWLEFETDSGKAYRIERTFGKKASEDTFRLLSLPDLRGSEDFSDPVGLALFGLNARCFIRSVFCTGSLWSPQADSDSGLLVERFGENASESKNLDDAIKKLEEWRREFQTKTGDRGIIPDQRREIINLEEQVRELRSLSDKIAENRSQSAENERKIAACNDELAALKESIDRAARSEAENALRAHYRELSANAERLRKERLEKEAAFGGTVPTERELDQLTELSGRQEQAVNRARIANRPFACEKEYADLSECFSSGLPDSEAMEDYTEKEGRLTLLQHGREELIGSPDFRSQSALFYKGIPDDEQLEAMIDRARSDQTAPSARKQGGFLPAVVSAAGILLLIFGVAALVMWGLVGLLPLLAGAGCVLFGLYARLKKPKSHPSREQDETPADFLARYGLDDKDPLSALIELKMKAGVYRSQMKKLKEYTDEMDALSADLREFLDYYRCPDIRTLSDRVRRYPDLVGMREEYLDEQKKADSELSELSEMLHERLAKYPVDASEPSAAIGILRKRLSDLTVCSASLAAAERDLKIFAASHSDLDPEFPEASGDSVEMLRQKEQILQNRRDELTIRSSGLDAQYSQLTRLADQLPALEERLNHLKDEHTKSLAARDAILRAEELLNRASQNLSDRYLTDVQKRFSDYTAILLENTGETDRYRMDGALTVLSEEAGKQRPAATLSRGRQDLVALCARLALSDALFEGKADFLILDDPFVNLDDGRMKSTLSLLTKLAEDRQILYLTCSESRMPK
ncbi:MAG: ATP-binding protein [Eubacteriales bacterium]